MTHRSKNRSTPTLCQRTAADNLMSDDRTVRRESDGELVMRENFDGRDLLIWRATTDSDTSYEMYRIQPDGEVLKV